MIAPRSSAPRGCALPREVRWIQGEHPIPGPGSLAAGAELLEFFDALGRKKTRRLTVFLSGGASSLAWVKPAELSLEDLQARLFKLYRSALDIRALNQKRSRLCRLKQGGAARWLHRLAPRVRARVLVISDVAPFGPEVVGSGPFYDATGGTAPIPHRLIADNRVWVQSCVRRIEDAGGRLLFAESGWKGPWQQWTRRIGALLRREGFLVIGGEPQVALPRSHGSGGRMSHLALSLACEHWEEIRAGELQILCASSDGIDGHSRSAGAWVRPSTLRSVRNPHVLLGALTRFDSAEFLREHSALLPSPADGMSPSNVQDLVLIRTRPR